MSDLIPHTALLLAAGGSTRLGHPKQLLNIRGVPLVRHMARLLLKTSPVCLVIVTGGAETEVLEVLDGLDALVVHNGNWKTGMASSLQCGLRTLSSPATPLLIAGTDQPRLSEQHLLTLLKHGRGGQDVVTDYGDNARGIPVLLSPDSQKRIDMLRGDTGLRQLWKTGAGTPICVSAPELGFDIDTPAELETAEQAGWIDPT